MNDYIEQASANVRLQEGSRVIEQLLVECYLKPGISTKELARKTLLPVPVAAAVKKELIKAGVLQQGRGVYCTSTGNSYIEKVWGYDGIDKRLYQKLMEKETDWKSELADLILRLQPWFQARPQVNVQIDQSKCTLETSLSRAILGLRNHTLIGKKVLCVGDDDLVSVSIGFLLKRLFPSGSYPNAMIDVVDIDERFLSFIREIAEQEKLPIACHQVDLREPLPERLQRQYDCFFTDPPYTLQGMTLFLSRGISALKSNKGLPIFFSFAHKSPDFMLAMQREFIRMGLTAGETIPSFNEYEGAEMIGNRGQMIILKTTEQTRPDITTLFEDALYTGEVKRTLRTYSCKECGESVIVGFQGTYATIEDLKNEGCPRCRHDTFDLKHKKTV
ncbi:bis-aminopropyl spermidine synthase family protein [Paenibacillus sp. J2TS4]|uniref:bis-aminopropyl spermidine synthase family protein n=1 Tax=Paenibacillus sp. J2TS4 TaxID=2807194 RepID=UPI001B2B6BA9|nr:bis-aminopropyl spermidine synthase family protein [Paenibacillus sp. J2TS4]GIP35043.1 methyltransferase [Paenibacillus sp. J2TS4]